MRFKIMFSVLVIGATLAVPFSKGQSVNGKGPESQDRRLAVDLVRAINTAEMAYRDRSGGSFAGWAGISASPEFTSAIARSSHGEPKFKNVNLSSPGEILPGWGLRLTLSEDRKSYTVILVNTADQCSYSLTSDQEGIIREGRAIGCSNSK
jgi:hypothetical protein